MIFDITTLEFHVEWWGVAIILSALLLSNIFVRMAESRRKRLNAYANKFGFDRECEKADLTNIKDPSKLERILSSREIKWRQYNRMVRPKQDNESEFRYRLRRYLA